MHHLLNLLLLLPALSACQSTTTATTTPAPSPTPGTLEVDLIFPLFNSTFSSYNPIPVVFAVQNPLLTNYMSGASISWSVNPISSPFNLSAPGAQQHTTFLGNYNSSTPSPYLSVGFFYEMVGLDNHWIFTWSLSSKNWTDVSGGYDYWPTVTKSGEVYFTTNHSAAPPDLLMSNDDCASRESAVLEVEGYHQNPEGAAMMYEAIVGNDTPKATPCKVQMNASRTSAVAAQITSTICANPTYDLKQLNVSCNGYQNAHSGVGRGVEAGWGGGVGAVLAMVLGVGLML